MKDFFWNIPTACVTILFSFLYWNSGQKDEAAVIFVAGTLSVWVIVTMRFLFQIKKRNRNYRFKLIKRFKNSPPAGGDGGLI
jgi:hypothetical protein